MAVVVVPEPRPPTSRRLPAACIPAQRQSSLVRRVVDDPDGAGLDVVDRHDRRQRRQPRPVRRSVPAIDAASRSRSHHLDEFARRGVEPSSAVSALPVLHVQRSEPLQPGPVHDAVWKTTSSSGPRRIAARPATDLGNIAGVSSPTTSGASARSLRRNASLRFVFALMSSVTTPAGRCVASSRWRPRLRPRLATPTSAASTPGNPWPARRTRRSRRPVAAHRHHLRAGRAEVLGQIRRPHGTQQALPTPHLGLQADERAGASASSRSVTTPTVWGSRARRRRSTLP